MRWVKYRHTFSYGCDDWTYEPLYLDRLTKEHRKEISYEMELRKETYEYSEHYRGIEWFFLSTRQVPNAHIKKAHAAAKRSITNHILSAQRARINSKRLKPLVDTGRKTCPDDLKRKKRDKQFAEAHERRLKKWAKQKHNPA